MNCALPRSIQRIRACSLLPDGRRGYWVDLHTDDPAFLPEVTDLLAEEGWERLPYPLPADKARAGHSVADVAA